MSNKIELENGSIIEPINNIGANVRSKRGQEQLLNNLLRDLYNKTDEELLEELEEDGIEYSYNREVNDNE